MDNTLDEYVNMVDGDYHAIFQVIRKKPSDP